MAAPGGPRFSGGMVRNFVKKSVSIYKFRK